MNTDTPEKILEDIENKQSISIDASDKGTAINEIKKGVEITLNGHKISFGDLPNEISDEYLIKKIEQYSTFLDFLRNQLREQQAKTSSTVTTEMDVDRAAFILGNGTAKIFKNIAKTLAGIFTILAPGYENNGNGLFNILVIHKITERLKGEVNKFKSDIEGKVGETDNESKDRLFKVIYECSGTLQHLLESQKNELKSTHRIISD